MSELPPRLPGDPNCALPCVTSECIIVTPHCQRTEHASDFRDMSQLGTCSELGRCGIAFLADDEL